MFSRFLVVGVFCFALNLLILKVGTGIRGWHYLISMVVSLLICSAVNFTLNKKWTFEASSGSFWRQLGRFYVVNLNSYAWNLGLSAVLITGLGVPYLLASSILAIGMTLINFALHKNWSFAVNKPQ